MTAKVSPIECDQNFNQHWHQKEKKEVTWIRKHIKLRKRLFYMPSDDKENEDEMEQMQIPISTLSQEVEITSAQLNMNLSEHEYTIPTDAFGEIKFDDPQGNIAKFVRVESKTDTSTILELMTNVWEKQKPNLLISVTGSADNYNIESELIDTFKYELIKAANSTDAWIITGGTYTGVTKHVGEAATYYGLTTTNPKCAIIGIAPWGVIQNREVLVNEKGSWPAKYDTETEEIRDVKDSFLDPNHSHFILIDDGTEHEYKTELSFRAKLERKISEIIINKGDDNVDQINLGSVVSGVPTVLLVLEGGPGTLETVENALKENTPVVIVKGSGGAADTLAYAFEYASDDEENQDIKLMNQVLETEIRKQLKNMLCSEEKTEKMDDTIKLIENCLAKSNLIHICKWYSGSGDLNMETAILKALLKGCESNPEDDYCLLVLKTTSMPSLIICFIYELHTERCAQQLYDIIGIVHVFTKNKE